MCSFAFRPPLVRPIARGRSPLCLEACRRAVCLQMGAVHHEGVPAYTRLSQVSEDPGQHPKARPTDDAVVQRFVRPADGRSILLPEPVAQDVEEPAQHPPAIHPWLASGLGRVRLEPLDLLRIKVRDWDMGWRCRGALPNSLWVFPTRTRSPLVGHRPSVIGLQPLLDRPPGRPACRQRHGRRARTPVLELRPAAGHTAIIQRSRFLHSFHNHLGALRPQPEPFS